MVLAIIAGLFASISWGVADFLAAHAAKHIHPVVAACFVQMSGALLYVLLFLVAFRHDANFAAGGMVYGAIAGATMSIGLALLYSGLHHGPVSLVSPISGAYPLSTTVVLLVCFHEKLAAMQLLGIGIIAVGVALAADMLRTRQAGVTRFTRGVRLAVYACLVWGVSFAMLGRSTTSIGWQTASLMYEIFAVVGFVAIAPFIKGEHLYRRKNLSLFKNKLIIITGLLQMVGIVVFNIGVAHASSPAIITAISATYPALTAILALKRLEESVRLVPLFGAVVSIIGVVLLSLQS